MKDLKDFSLLQLMQEIVDRGERSKKGIVEIEKNINKMMGDIANDNILGDAAKIQMFDHLRKLHIDKRLFSESNRFINIFELKQPDDKKLTLLDNLKIISSVMRKEKEGDNA